MKADDLVQCKKTGRTGKIIHNDKSVYKPIYVHFFGCEQQWVHETDLKLITMNDNDKIELTVADVKAAHAKGCSSVKQTLETMYPKVFEEKLSFQGQYLHLGDREIGQVSNNGIEIYCGYQAILQGSKVIFRKK